jgi:hypothetical protein
MDAVTAGKMAEALWIDPTTGTQVFIGRFAATGMRSFSPPDNCEDALLVLEATDKQPEGDRKRA